MNFGGATRSRLRRVGDAGRRERLVHLLEELEARRAADNQR
jgi:hypothetical protein